MSPLAKALIAYTTKLRLVLYFHLLATNSSCANIQCMIWFLFLSGEGARAVHLQFIPSVVVELQIDDYSALYGMYRVCRCPYILLVADL